MKKKLISIVMSFIMMITAFAYIPTIYAQESNNAYGEYAYSVIKYLDKNLAKRISATEQEQKAAEYIKGELESFGYNVEIQDFNYERKGETHKSQNVVATKKGTSSKEIIIGAHYDSVGTNGVDDNGSGVAVNLETSKRLADKKTPYTIKFVFFGSEEVGCKGSKAYSDKMTQEQIDNTVYMVNMDSILAGTYRYIYSGNYDKDSEVVKDTWPALQAMELSKELDLGMNFNDTELNLDYPTPSTGNWSDHVNFRYKMPYLYFEAVNWELPDNPNHPEWGSSGAYETELGEVMHNPERDNLEFIESNWPGRGQKTLAAFCELLETAVYQLNPDGLVKPSKDKLTEAIEKAYDTDRSQFSDSAYKIFVQALKEAKEVSKKEYILLKDQSIIDDATEKLNKSMSSLGSNIEDATIKVEDQTYNGKSRRPEVTVKFGDKELQEGEDYTVSYYNNREIGQATVSIRGCNDYFGYVKQTFDIIPQTVTGAKLDERLTNSLKISWDKVDNADGYKLYKFDISSRKYVLIDTIESNKTTTYQLEKLISATNYYYKICAYKKVDGETYTSLKSDTLKVTTRPLQPVVRLSSTSRGKVSIKYTSKVSKRTEGYKIYMATSKYGRYRLVKETDKTSYLKTSLTSRKGYYFKVRAYRTIDGENLYSLYSLPKYIRVK